MRFMCGLLMVLILPQCQTRLLSVFHLNKICRLYHYFSLQFQKCLLSINTGHPDGCFTAIFYQLYADFVFRLQHMDLVSDTSTVGIPGKLIVFKITLLPKRPISYYGISTWTSIYILSPPPFRDFFSPRSLGPKYCFFIDLKFRLTNKLLLAL